MNSSIFQIITSLLMIGTLLWIIIKLVEKNKRQTKNINNDGIINSFESAKTANLRKYERISKNVYVEVKRNNGTNEIFKGQTKDISIMGAFIICKNKININEDIQVNFYSKVKNRIWLDAKVVWSNTNMPEKKIIIPGFGIKFLNLEADKKNYLYSLLDNKNYC
ncbi:MAG: PilZ domain-containing protein [Desulfobacteraceae bacterium]|nr:PilZ domain-containing protein [Desulfobacteraceae bacterium]